MELKPIFDIDNTIDQTEYYWYKDGFVAEELDWIDNLSNLYQFEEVSIVGSTSYSSISEIRNCKIKWIPCGDLSMWIYDKLKNLSIEANNTLWKFDLHSIIDSIQWTLYSETNDSIGAVSEHYNWHVDIGPGINHRKISIIVQLSDPNDYEGGDLEIWSGGQFKTVSKNKGCVVIFPSFLLHRVAPVTKGVRKSLVLWIGGGSYK